uniref:Putative tick kunitz 1 n=1 Tax=Amblyomma triste TaxID=251400 RepID=A0A023G6P7_AMBTT
MKLLLILFLLCLNESIADDKSRRRGRPQFPPPYVNKSLCIKQFDASESRDLPCTWVGLKRLYHYDPHTGHCKLFLHKSCDDCSENCHKSVRLCLETCNPNSKCLITKWGHKDGIHEGYTYRADWGLCVPRKFKGTKTWPSVNRFNTFDECHEACTPEEQLPSLK